MDKCKPYTQAELDQQAIWADEFDQWWESEGQYHRAGGDNYCRTFAWWAWLSREQSRQPEVDALKNLLEKDEYAHNLYYENANLQTLVEEKDKRIGTLITTWRNQTKELCNVDDKHVREALLSCADELEALRGEHE